MYVIKFKRMNEQKISSVAIKSQANSCLWDRKVYDFAAQFY